MHSLTSTTGIVALAGAGVAAVSLLFAIYLATRVRRGCSIVNAGS